MLTKLLKHEYKATGRILLPMYLVVLVLAVLGRFTYVKDGLAILGSNFYGFGIYNGAIIGAIITLLFISCLAAGITTFFVLMQRFYKNLFSDEGYLTCTLPVKSRELIISKLIVALSWTICSVIAGFLTVIVIFCNEIDSSLVTESVKKLYNWNEYRLTIILTLLLMFSLYIENILKLYLAISIGQLSSVHRVWVSIGAYIAVNSVISFVSGIFIFIVRDFIDIDSEAAIWIQLARSIVFAVIFFVLTNHIVKNKLNLQ